MTTTIDQGFDEWDDWFGELKEQAVRDYGFSEAAAKTFDPLAWGVWFEQGLTPAQALVEETWAAE